MRVPVPRVTREAWPANSYLSRLPDSALADVFSIGERRTFPAGTVLIAEGAADTDAFVLVSGFVKITSRLGSGHDALLAIRMGGDVIGEIGALGGGPRIAAATACRIYPTEAVVIAETEFRAFLARHPDASALLTAALGERLRWANRRRIEFGSCDVRVRTARVIVELATTYGRQLPGGEWTLGPTLTQLELAALAGATQPSVQRALQDLRAAGLIGTGYRAIVVRDLDRLRATAGLPPD